MMLFVLGQTPEEIGMFKMLFDQYGPIGFGLVALLVVWLVIVNPILKYNKVDLATVKTIAESLNTTASSLKTTADTMQMTATTNKESSIILAEAVKDMSSITTRLEKIGEQNAVLANGR